MTMTTQTIPQGWKVTTLGEVTEIKHGYAFKGEYISDVENDNILLTPGNFFVGGGWKGGKKYYTGEIPKEYVLQKDDLVVTMTDLSKDGDTLGYPALIPNNPRKKYLHNQRVGLVALKGNTISKRYLYYLMSLRDYQKYIVNTASGSTVRHTSPKKIQSFEFNCPPSAEQTAIAAVLSALDDKIELLRRQNKTLEGIAQTLFKRWFVDYEFPNEKGKPYKSSGGKIIESELGEIPAGWRVGRLEDEFKIIMGQSPDGSSYNEDRNGMVFFQGRTDFQERFPVTRLYTTEPKRIAEKHDILVSVRAPVGDINVAFERCCIGRGLGAVRGKHKSYTLYKIRSLKDILKNFETEGTVFGSINKDSFMGIEVIIPPAHCIEKYEEIASPIDQKIFINTTQIQTLACLRDSLLPKLMKGEIRVDGFSHYL